MGATPAGFSSSPNNRSTADTKPSAQSSRMLSHSTKSPSGSATSPRRCDPWPVVLVSIVAAASRPPFSRGRSRAEPRARPHAPLARRGPLPLRAAAGPTRLRPSGHGGRVSRLGDGARPEWIAVALGVETARQGTPQSHRRLQLRRGPRPVRRPQRPPQEVVRDRLLLPGRPHPATGPVAGVGQGPGPRDVPRVRGILARLPSDPLPRRPLGARPPLLAAPRQGRPQRADVLRAGTNQPLPVLRQRQPDPRRSAWRADAVRGVLARGRRFRPQVAPLRQQGGRLPRTVACQPTEDPLRHHSPPRGSHPPTPGATASFRLESSRDRHPQTL